MNTYRIIVVGATGYIGKVLHARAKINSVVFGTTSTVKDKFLFLRLDVPEDFDYGFIQSSDVVLLTAAISSPDICAHKHDYAWTVNVTGTSRFIGKVIARGGRVIFFSSDTVYGERSDEFDEKIACNPAGEYAEMKLEVEKRFFGNPHFKSIRLSYVFSREDKFTRYLIGCAKRGEEAEIFHPFFRAVVHRGDVVEGAIALAQHWDEFSQRIINFGGPEVLARTKFAKILQERALPNLRFRVTEPEADFFKNRPRIIQMKSPVLASLLGRSAFSLGQAAMLEFKKSEEEKHD